MEEAYWLTHGFWHSSLILAILGILLSASEMTVLHILGPLHSNRRENVGNGAFKRYKPLLLSQERNDGQVYTPRWKMVFTWQGPLMFMSYSVCTFLAGLTILVCTPFIREGGEWSAGHSVRSRLKSLEVEANILKIATMYLTVLAAGLATFVFCSYWVYYYVDLNFETNEEEEGFGEHSLYGFSSVEQPNINMPFPGRGTSSGAAFHESVDPSRRSDTLVQGPWRKGSV
jgi:hypothetical protein